MRLVESKPRMVRQMHVMHEVDWICQPGWKRKAKNVLFGKTSITFAYEFGLR